MASQGGLGEGGPRSCTLEPGFCLADVPHREAWSRELATWRAVAGEHGRMMQSWRKAWVRGPGGHPTGLCGGGGPNRR